jgi:hypothetical protein
MKMLVGEFGKVRGVAETKPHKRFNGVLYPGTQNRPVHNHLESHNNIIRQMSGFVEITQAANTVTPIPCRRKRWQSGIK